MNNLSQKLSIQLNKNQTEQQEIENLVISQQKEKHNELAKMINIRDSQLSGLSTEFVSIYGKCCYCGLSIKERKLQTDCQHNFHEECFDTMVNAQIQNKCQFLSCFCDKNLKLKCMQNFLKDKQMYNIYKERFLSNQIEILKKQNKNMIKSCVNQSCFFFVLVKQDNFIEEQMYCPVCQP